MGRISYSVILILLTSCSLLNVFYSPDLKEWSKLRIDDSHSLIKDEDSSICVIGDTGELGDEIALSALYRSIQQDTCSNVFLLGDLIYPYGLPPLNEILTINLEKCLKIKEKREQVKCLELLVSTNEFKNWETYILDSDSSFSEKFLPMYSFFESKKKVFLLMGNHDYAHNSSLSIAKRAMLNWVLIHHSSKIGYSSRISRFRNIHFPKHYFTFEMSNQLCVLVLDTETIYQGTYHNEKKGVQYHPQKEWVSSINSSFLSKKCKFKIVFGHQPYLSSGSRHGQNDDLLMGNLNKLPPVLREFYEDNIIGNYNLIVSGHDHHISNEGEILKNNEKSGTYQFISGSGGHTLSETKPRLDMKKNQGRVIWPESKQPYWGYIKITPYKDRLESIFKIVVENNEYEKEQCLNTDQTSICEAHKFRIFP